MVENTIGRLPNIMDGILQRASNAQKRNRAYYADITFAAYYAAGSTNYWGPSAIISKELLVKRYFDGGQLDPDNPFTEALKFYADKFEPDLNLLIDDMVEWHKKETETTFQAKFAERLQTIVGTSEGGKIGLSVLAKRVAILVYGENDNENVVNWVMGGDDSLVGEYISGRSVPERDELRAALEELRYSFTSRIRNQIRYVGLNTIDLYFIEAIKEKIQAKVEALRQEPTQLIQFQSVPLSIVALLKFSPIVTLLLYSVLYLSYVNAARGSRNVNSFPNFGIYGDVSSYFSIVDFDSTLRALNWAICLAFPLILISLAIVFDFKIYDLEYWWTRDQAAISSGSNVPGTQIIGPLTFTSVMDLFSYIGTLVLLFRISFDDRRQVKNMSILPIPMLLFLITLLISVIYFLKSPLLFFQWKYALLFGYFGSTLVVPFYFTLNVVFAAISMKRSSAFLSFIVLLLQVIPMFYVDLSANNIGLAGLIVK